MDINKLKTEIKFTDDRTLNLLDFMIGQELNKRLEDKRKLNNLTSCSPKTNCNNTIIVIGLTLFLLMLSIIIVT